MNTIILGDISIEVDVEKTKTFYKNQALFICDCKHCLNYVSKIDQVKSLLKGFDNDCGIDLTKAVGQGMDELMPHDYKDHHLYVTPYYIVGKCSNKKVDLQVEQSGPIWSDTKRVEYKVSENISLRIINTTGSVSLLDAQNILTIWVEFKTPLIK